MVAGTLVRAARRTSARPRRPNEVDLQRILVFDLGDVVKARDWAVTKFGNLSSAFAALTSLHNYLEGAWQGGEGKVDVRALSAWTMTALYGSTPPMPRRSCLAAAYRVTPARSSASLNP